MNKIILSAIIGAFLLSGCDSDTIVVDAPDDLIEANQTVALNCDEEFSLVAVTQGDSNLTVSHPLQENTFSNLGMDIEYIVYSPCPIVDENLTEEVVPEDGVCPEGYKVTECNTCIELPPITCGEGTMLEDENNTCIVAPEDVYPCGEGTEWDSETELCEVAE